MRNVRVVLFVFLAFGAASALAQDSTVLPPASAIASGSPSRSLFLPRNWVRGYTDFEGAPPRNEPDLGRCGPASETGPSAPCAAFARYIFSGYLEIQPMGRTPLRRLLFFYQPQFFFGKNVPQLSYTTSFSAIAYERTIGAGIELPRHFEVRIQQHQSEWLGRYRHNLGAGDLGTDGPYGLYSTIGVRWYFGGYGRSNDSSKF